MLQKLIEDRKLLEERIDYAAIPKILAMNFTFSVKIPFSSFSICPFFNIRISSELLIVCLTMLNEPNPLLGLSNCLISR